MNKILMCWNTILCEERPASLVTKNILWLSMMVRRSENGRYKDGLYEYYFKE